MSDLMDRVIALISGYTGGEVRVEHLDENSFINTDVQLLLIGDIDFAYGREITLSHSVDPEMMTLREFFDQVAPQIEGVEPKYSVL